MNLSQAIMPHASSRNGWPVYIGLKPAKRWRSEEEARQRQQAADDRRRERDAKRAENHKRCLANSFEAKRREALAKAAEKAKAEAEAIRLKYEAMRIQWMINTRQPMDDRDMSLKAETHAMRRGLKLPKGWSPTPA